MAIAQIDTWLNNPARTYSEGKELFTANGGNFLKVAFFNGGDSLMHMQQLQQALRELNKAAEPNLQVHKKSEPVHKITVENAAISSAELKSKFPIPQTTHIYLPQKRYSVSDEAWNKYPDAIKDLFTENKRLDAHSSLLFNQCRATFNVNDRLALNVQILDEREKINRNWTAIKLFQEKGEISEEIKKAATKAVDEMSFTELAIKLKNLPTYISKAKKELADPKKKDKKLQDIQNWQLQILMINKRLEAGK